MAKVAVIGVGTGIDMLTLKGKQIIEEARVLIGASRLIEMYASSDKRIYDEYKSAEIEAIIRDEQNKLANEAIIAVLMSGDVGFFSGATGLMEILGEQVILIPGISSVASFFAKLGRSWQDVTLVSMHGRETNIVDMVRRNVSVFALTGGNIDEIGNRLCEAGYGALNVTIGSCLDSDEEKIITLTVEEMARLKWPALSVILIDNPGADGSVRSGIADDEFIRGEVPMTKSEVRSVIMSKLAISPSDICIDVGAGTGSVTVEMALAAWNGRVYSIEQKSEGCELIKANIRSFHIGNVNVCEGEATELLPEIPAADVAFIGGSSGNLSRIIELVLAKNPDTRIVISAIALETLETAISTVKGMGMKTEVVQIATSRSREAGGLHMMMACNPVFIIKVVK